MDKFGILLLAALEKNVGKSIQDQLNQIKDLSINDVKIKINADNIQSELKKFENKAKGTKIEIFDSEKLDEQGRKYFTKTTNILKQVKDYYKKNGAISVDIKDTEKSNGQIRKFTATVTEATGVINKFNFERAKINTGGAKPNYGFVQSELVTSLDKLSGTKLKQTEDYLSRISNKIKDINSKAFNQSNPLITEDTTSKYNNKLDETLTRINDIRSSSIILSDTHKRDINNMVADLERYLKELKELQYAATKLKPDTFQDTKATLQAQLKTNTQKWTQSGILSGDFKRKVEEAKQLLDNATDPSQLNKFHAEFKLLNEDFKQTRDAEAYANQLENIKLRASGAGQSFQAYLSKLKPSALREFSIEIQNISDQFDKVAKTGDKVEFSNANSKLAEFKSTMKATGNETASFTQIIKQNIQAFLNWYLIGNVVSNTVRQIKQMVVNVVELDDSLVELRKVSDLTGKSLNNFVKDAYDAGEAVARTGKDVVDATTQYKRAGYQLEESFDLAKTSLVMMNVGDGISSVEQAASSLIAILKGFKLSATDAMSVVDMINNVSNNAAIDFDNIADGLRRVSGTLSQTGTSIQQTIALLTGGFSQLRNIELVSRGLVTISQRLRGVSETGETIDGLSAKLQSTFKRIAGIDIETATGLRSTYDILQDMANVFPTLTERQRQYLGELAAGKDQVKVLNSILNGWEDVDKATSFALNAEGSALEENEKVLDSIQGKVNAYKSAFQSLSNDIVDEDLIKFIVDSGTNILKLLDDTIEKLGLFPTLITAISGVISAKNAGFLRYDSINGWSNAFSSFIKNAKSAKTVMSNELANEFVKFRDEMIRTGKSAEVLAEEFGSNVTPAIIEFAKTGDASSLTIKDFEHYLNGMTVSAQAASVAMKALSIAVNMLIGLGISLAIQGIVTGITKLVNANQDAIDKAEELTKKYQDMMDTLNANQGTVEGLKEEFEKLSKGVSDSGKNISLSTDEYKRYQDIVNTIVAISPELVKGYDNEGNAIADKNSLIEESIRLIQEERREKLLDQTTDKNNWTIAKGNIASLDQERKEAKKSRDQVVSELLRSMTHDKNGKYINDLSEEIYDSFMSAFQLTENKMIDKSSTSGYSGLLTAVLAHDDNRKKIIDALENDFSVVNQFVDGVDLTNITKEYQDYVRSLKDVENAEQSFNSQLKLVAQSSDYYDKLSEATQNFVNTYIDGFRLTGKETSDQIEKMTNSILYFVETLSNNSDAQIKIEQLFNLKSNLPVDEYVKQYQEIVEEIIKAIDGADGTGLSTEEEISIRTKLNFKIDNTINLRQAVNDKLKELGISDSDNYIGELSAADLKIVYSFVADENTFTSIDDIKDKLEEAKQYIEEPISLQVQLESEEFGQYLADVDKIRNAISKSSEMTSSEIASLMKDFSQYSDIFEQFSVTGEKGVGNLEGALKALLGKIYETTTEALGFNQVLKSIYDETMNTTDSTYELSNAMQALSDSNDLIKDLKEEYKELGTISTDSLNRIINTYPQLTQVVTDFITKQKEGTDVIAALDEAYKIDVDNYRNAVLSKKSLDSDFYKETINNLPDWVKNLADNYQIDLDNYTNLQKAKLGLDKELAMRQTLLKPFSDEKFMSNLPFGDRLGYNNIKRYYETSINDIQKIINSIDTSLDTSINLRDYQAPPDKKSKKKTDPKWLVDYKNAKADLDHRLAMDKVTEEEYYKELEKLTNKYLKKHKKTHLDLYRKNVEEIYKGMKKINSDAIKAEFYDLKYSFDMDKIDEDTYYKRLKDLNDKYYKDSSIKEYQDAYKSNLLELHKWEIEQDEKKFQKKIKLYDKYLEEIDHIINFIDPNSVEQITLLQTGYAQASSKVKDLNTEIDKLNKQYSKGKISEETYTKRLETLTSQLFSATNAMKNYSDSIISAMKARYDEQRNSLEKAQKDELDSLENSHKKIIDNLEKQINKYKEIVDEKKKSLRVTKEEHEYQKKINEHTKNISDLESRIADLSKAATSGDREAQAEKRKLEDELAKEKDNLKETQYDREVELAEDALDESYDAYQKMLKKQIEDQNDIYERKKTLAEKEYNTKLENIEKLYDNEKQLIIEAAELTGSEFSKAFTSINETLSQYGMSVSDDFKNVYNSIGNSISGIAKVSSILGDGSKKGKDTSGLSQLNQWLGSRGYNTVNKKQMVEIAQALGLTEIKSVKDVQDTPAGRKNKNLILKALKDAKFESGGYIDASMVRSVGEHGLALVRHGESVLTVEQGKLFRELITNIKPLNNLVKLNSPVNHMTNNNVSPKFVFNLNGGTITKDAMPDFNKMVNDATEKVTVELLNMVRKR